MVNILLLLEFSQFFFNLLWTECFFFLSWAIFNFILTNTVLLVEKLFIYKMAETPCPPNITLYDSPVNPFSPHLRPAPMMGNSTSTPYHPAVAVSDPQVSSPRLNIPPSPLQLAGLDPLQSTPQRPCHPVLQQSTGVPLTYTSQPFLGRHLNGTI